MATETLISPGVLTTENDQSFITQGPVTVGLALVGPTVKGPSNIPTVVTSYSDFKNKFGGSFTSESTSYEYLTSITAQNYFQQFSQGGGSILVNRVTSGSFTSATASVWTGGSTTTNNTASFTLATITQGALMNNYGGAIFSGSNGTLTSGSNENIRFEIQNVNSGSGTFTLIIRQANDTTLQPSVLETFTGCSLDPNSPNYIEAVVGNQYKSLEYDASSGYYVKTNGDYPNRSRYVYIQSVNRPTLNFFDNNGVAKNEYTSSSTPNSYLPIVGSGSYQGSFSGASGENPQVGTSMFTGISTTTQGFTAGYYGTASAILANTDEYDFSLITTPGLENDDHGSAIGNFITMAENRGDCFYITDLTKYNATLGTATAEANSLNTSYAGAYWPWVQVASQETGKLVWVPASTVMPGVYAFNDRVSAEWFAPAGLTRGGLGGVIQAERKLSPTDRDNLYASKVNPIATFPGVGVVAYGQKTLQTKASALDRINVRRLLINLKRFVGNVGETLVFEQNTAVTRNNFLASVNPYLEAVQQKQGLYAFKVVMDDSNNTPDVIDRNQLVGQIYIQPTKTVEFVLLSFNITPTGASFS